MVQRSVQIRVRAVNDFTPCSHFFKICYKKDLFQTFSYFRLYIIKICLGDLTVSYQNRMVSKISELSEKYDTSNSGELFYSIQFKKVKMFKVVIKYSNKIVKFNDNEKHTLEVT